MTKMKSKKMTKSTFAIIIMGIAMVAMLAFGATFAYFTAKTNNVTGSIKTGKVEISTGTKTTLATISSYVVPGTQLYDDEAISLTNTSTVDIYVYAKLTAKLGTQDLYVKTSETEDAYAPVLTAVLGNVTNSTWAAVTGEDGVYGYKVTGNTTTPTDIADFKFDVTFNSAISELHTQGAFTSNNIYTKSGEQYTAFNKTIEDMDITITVEFSAIQASESGEIASAYALIK